MSPPKPDMFHTANPEEFELAMRLPTGNRLHTNHRRVASRRAGTNGVLKDLAVALPNRSGYTLAELMLLVALAAILVAIFIDIRQQFSVYNRWIASISMSGDGSRVTAGMLDGSARVWDTRTGVTVGSVRPAESN